MHHMFTAFTLALVPQVIDRGCPQHRSFLYSSMATSTTASSCGKIEVCSRCSRASIAMRMNATVLIADCADASRHAKYCCSLSRPLVCDEITPAAPPAWRRRTTEGEEVREREIEENRRGGWGGGDQSRRQCGRCGAERRKRPRGAEGGSHLVLMRSDHNRPRALLLDQIWVEQ